MTGSDVREMRDQRGWTRKELARKLGVHWNTINKWERGERGVSPFMALLLRLVMCPGEKVEVDQERTPRQPRVVRARVTGGDGRPGHAADCPCVGCIVRRS